MRQFPPLAVLALSACATPTVERYSPSAENVVLLRDMKVASIGVGTITEPVKDDTKCRGIGKVRLQDGLTHAEYIRRALVDELRLGGGYTEVNPAVTLTGDLAGIDSASGLGNKAKWAMTLVLRSTNGRTLTISEDYRFKGGFAATAACNNVAQAFTPAVQNLIGKVIKSPDFAALIKP